NAATKPLPRKAPRHRKSIRPRDACFPVARFESRHKKDCRSLESERKDDREPSRKHQAQTRFAQRRRADRAGDNMDDGELPAAAEARGSRDRENACFPWWCTCRCWIGLHGIRAHLRKRT